MIDKINVDAAAAAARENLQQRQTHARQLTARSCM